MASTKGPIGNLAGSNVTTSDPAVVPQHVVITKLDGTIIETFAGSGGTSAADGDVFTPNTTTGTPAMGAYQSAPSALTDGDLGIVGLDVNRNLKVNVVAGGTAGVQYTEGDVDATITGNALMLEGAGNTLVAAPGTAASGLLNQPTGAPTGGHSIYRSLDLDETEEEVKSTAGTIYAILFTNTAATTRWLKIYDNTAAVVIVGTTVPVMTFGLPGNASDDISGAVPIPQGGIAFATAITIAATTGVADADTGAPAANDVIVNVLYR